jgi:PAS domain S-box-containing protein
MPPPEVIALADQVRAHLERGDLAGLGPVELSPDGVLADADKAARIVLADVEHRARREGHRRRPASGQRWDDLAAQLRALQRAAAAHARLDVGRWAWDLVEDRVSWSDEHYRIFGLEPGTFAGALAAFLARVHPDDVARVRAATDAALRTGEPLDYQARLVRPDGEVRVFRCRGAVRADARGRPRWMLGTVQDVTGRRADGEQTPQ